MARFPAGRPRQRFETSEGPATAKAKKETLCKEARCARANEHSRSLEQGRARACWAQTLPARPLPFSPRQR